MRTRTEPAWATDHRISPSCGTWHSTSCRRMARRRRCAASFSGPDGTTPISPASWLYSEVQLPWLQEAVAPNPFQPEIKEVEAGGMQDIRRVKVDEALRQAPAGGAKEGEPEDFLQHV